MTYITSIKRKIEQSNKSITQKDPIDFLDYKKPLFFDIEEAYGLSFLMRLAARGCPFSFAGLGVMGLSGSYNAFIKDYHYTKEKAIPSIAKLKNRNFFKSPPVALASWSVLLEVVDWQKISGNFAVSEVKALIYKLYCTLPIHLVLPISKKIGKKIDFFPQTEGADNNENLNHAFMMCTNYFPLQNMLRCFERNNSGLLFATSANPHGQRTFSNPLKVAEIFKQLPFIIVDTNFLDPEGKDWPSHSMYDFTKFPQTVKVIRIGSVSHGLLNEVLLQSDFRPVVEFPRPVAEITLTSDIPPFNNFDSLQKLLKVSY